MKGDTPGVTRPNSVGHLHLPHWWIKAFEWGSLSTLGLNQSDFKNAWSSTEGSGIIPALQIHEYNALASILSTLQTALIEGQTTSIALHVDDHFKKAGSMAKSRLFAYERVLQWLGSVAIDLSQTMHAPLQAHLASPVDAPLHSKIPPPGHSAMGIDESTNKNRWIPIVEKARWIETPKGPLREASSPKGGFWNFLQSQQKAFESRHENSNTTRHLFHPGFSPDFSIQNGGGHKTSSSTDRSLSLMVDLGPLGPELCFGLADAHVSLVRHVFEKHLPDFLATPFKHPPLSLWRSLWLDLSPYETTLYLKLEKAMQWEFRWVDLDGAFGISLDDFLEEKVRNHPQAYHLIQRLGRKLEQHGHLAKMGPMQNKLLDLSGMPENSAPMLLWQASAQRILEDRVSEFKHQARQVLLRPLLEGDRKEQWLSLFRADNHRNETVAYGREVWDIVTEIAPKVMNQMNQYHSFEFHDTLLWSPQSLFFEWTMRSHPSSQWPPLPEVLKSSPLGALVDNPHGRYGPPDRRFEEFCLLLQDMPELCKILKEIPYASLASPITVNLIDWSPFRVSVIASLVSHPSEPTATAPTTPPLETIEPLETENTLPKEEPTAPKAVSLMRTAAVELGQLEKKNQTQYHELRRAYLASLDEIGQKLISDVQLRMQPHVFEEHLRKRIIRFMVENPGVWSVNQVPKAIRNSH